MPAVLLPLLAPHTRPSGGSRLTSLWSLYRLALRQFLHGKRPIVMLLVLILPACLVLVVRSTACAHQ